MAVQATRELISQNRLQKSRLPSEQGLTNRICASIFCDQLRDGPADRGDYRAHRKSSFRLPPVIICSAAVLWLVAACGEGTYKETIDEEVSLFDGDVS